MREECRVECRGDFDHAAGNVFLHVREQVREDLREGVGIEQARRGHIARAAHFETPPREGRRELCHHRVDDARRDARIGARSAACPRSCREKVSTLSIKRPSRRASSCTSASRRVRFARRFVAGLGGEIDVEQDVRERRAQFVRDAIDERHALRRERESATLLRKDRDAEQRHEKREHAVPTASVGTW